MPASISLARERKTLFLTPYDYDAGAYAETAEKYEILEITENKLVWQKEGSEVTNTFVSE